MIKECCDSRTSISSNLDHKTPITLELRPIKTQNLQKTIKKRKESDRVADFNQIGSYVLHYKVIYGHYKVLVAKKVLEFFGINRESNW